MKPTPVFKERAQHGDQEEQRAVAAALYYAAIAGAIVSCSEKITALSYGQVDRGLEKLLDKDWIPVELNDLLRKAQALIRHRPDGR